MMAVRRARTVAPFGIRFHSRSSGGCAVAPSAVAIRLRQPCPHEPVVADQSGQGHEIFQVTLPLTVGSDAVCGCLADKRGEQVGTEYDDVADVVGNPNPDRLRPIEGLRACGRSEGLRSGNGQELIAVAHVVGHENVHDDVAAYPSMRLAGQRVASGKDEATTGQDRGELPMALRIGPNVDKNIGVIGDTRGLRTALPAVQLHQLAADQSPPGWHLLGYVPQKSPRLCLVVRYWSGNRDGRIVEQREPVWVSGGEHSQRRHLGSGRAAQPLHGFLMYAWQLLDQC